MTADKDLHIVEGDATRYMRVTEDVRFGRRLPHAGEIGVVVRHNDPHNDKGVHSYLLRFSDGAEYEYTDEEMTCADGRD